MINRNVFMSRRNARGIYAPVRVERTKEARKVCSKCGETKPLSAFYRDKRAKDGHKSACKACSK